jgi:hypothetical protein
MSILDDRSKPVRLDLFATPEGREEFRGKIVIIDIRTEKILGTATSLDDAEKFAASLGPGSSGLIRFVQGPPLVDVDITLAELEGR